MIQKRTSICSVACLSVQVPPTIFHAPKFGSRWVGRGEGGGSGTLNISNEAAERSQKMDLGRVKSMFPDSEQRGTLLEILARANGSTGVNKIKPM